jgi:hypothetical protein
MEYKEFPRNKPDWYVKCEVIIDDKSYTGIFRYGMWVIRKIEDGKWHVLPKETKISKWKYLEDQELWVRKYGN